MPFTDIQLEKKRYLGLLVVGVDGIVILSFFIFIIILRNRQDEYIHQYKMQTIEMSDFTIRVENLPCDIAYGDNEHVLKAKLWRHFQRILAESARAQQ